MSGAGRGLALLSLVPLTASAGLIALGGVLSQSDGEQASTAAGLRAGAVPEDLAPLFAKHGDKCEAIDAPLLAAQAKAESGFDAHAQSEAGAQGVSQFMPATWASHGVDGDGDGKADVWNPADAIASQAAYDCYLSGVVAGVAGDPVELMLAAYNAGPYAVLEHRGVPPYEETRDYVARIQQLRSELAAPVQLVSGSQQLQALPKENPRTPRQAIAWARGQVNGDGVWYRRCLNFVAQSYGWSYSGVSYAIDHYDAVPARFRHTDHQPPPGALMYWDTGQRAGHVAIYLGDGLIASNDIEREGYIDVAPYDAPETKWGARYVGWTEPYFPHGGV